MKFIPLLFIFFVFSQLIIANPYPAIDSEGKLMYIDAKGDTVIPAGLYTPEIHFRLVPFNNFYTLKLNFDPAQYFYGDYAIAMIEKWFWILFPYDRDWVGIDKNGKQLFPPFDDKIFPFYSNIAMIYKPEKQGNFSIKDRYQFIDNKGKVITGLYNYAAKFSEDYALIMIDGKYGYINKNGEIAIEPKYLDAGHFSEGLSYFRTGDKYGYIDKSENIAIKEQFNIAKEFICGRARVFNGAKWYFIDKEGKRTSEFFEQVYDYSENIAIVQVANKYRYIDLDGKFINEDSYDVASNFKYGLAAIKQTGRWGYIDTLGKIKIIPQFELADDFIGEIAQITNNGEIYYINNKNEKVYTLIDKERYRELLAREVNKMRESR